MFGAIFFITALMSLDALPSGIHEAGDPYHPRHTLQGRLEKSGEDANFWNLDAQNRLSQQLQVTPIKAKAKNIIMFIGDGMPITTTTLARIKKGQNSGNWERERLVWEDFPYVSLSKTYSTDNQVTDSAASATALLGGVKTNSGLLGVDANVLRGNCTAQLNTSFHVDSIAKLFQDDGRSTGFVTTTRVTHATPAAVYSHIAERYWENDFQINADGEDPVLCDDIAEQLVLSDPGKNLKVILGGGRRNFYSSGVPDVENPLSDGYRSDGKDLVQAWQDDKTSISATNRYIWNRNDLLATDFQNTDYLLGLFAHSHMDYAVFRDPVMDPNLPEMVDAALQVLTKDPNGFFLLVEGGKIDLANHDNLGQAALVEALELDEAVNLALQQTDPQETLIIVTADHGHGISFNGYAPRNSDVLDLGGADDSGVNYTIIEYTSGPGYNIGLNGRPDPTGEDIFDVNYRQQSLIDVYSAYHGGQDVGVWAMGPNADLLSGVYEENYVAHVMTYSACVGSGLTFCP